MKKIVLFLMFSFAFVGNVLAADIFLPYLNLQEEAMEAAKNKKLVMVMFHMEHCPSCEYMQSEVLTNKDVKKYFTEKYNTYLIDVLSSAEVEDFNGISKSQKAIAKEYGANVTPTFAFYDGKGKMLYKTIGRKDVSKFLSLGKYISQEQYKRMDFSEYYLLESKQKKQ